MNILQIKNLYKVNGITDYKLKSTGDLLRMHDIDFKSVTGYKGLDDINRSLYEKFIVNIFNANGLESRTTLIPTGIYYVEDIEYLSKENPSDDYYVTIGGFVKSIDRNGVETILHSWNDEDYKHLAVTQTKRKKYLRFEYKHKGRKTWQHVIDEKSWY